MVITEQISDEDLVDALSEFDARLCEGGGIRFLVLDDKKIKRIAEDTTSYKIIRDRIVMVEFLELEEKGNKIILPHLKFATEIRIKDYKSVILPELIQVDGCFTLENINLVKCPKLKHIESDIDLYKVAQADFSCLKSVHSCFIVECKFQSLPSLEIIDGAFTCTDSSLKNLPKLVQISDCVHIVSADFDDISELTRIGGDAVFIGCTLPNMNCLREIMGNVYIVKGTELEAPNLTAINGDVEFGDCYLYLDKLEHILGNVSFIGEYKVDLPALTTILGNLTFNGIQIVDMPKLEEVSGKISFEFDYESKSKLGELNKIKNLQYTLISTMLNNMVNKYFDYAFLPIRSV